MSPVTVHRFGNLPAVRAGTPSGPRPLPPPAPSSLAHDTTPPVARPTAGSPAPDQPTTHLDVLLGAVRKAAIAWPTPRKPWREMLPEELDWFGIERPASASAPGRRGRYLTLGMLDDPAAQAQHPATFDLEDGGRPDHRRQRRIGEVDGDAHGGAVRGHRRHARRGHPVRHRLLVASADATDRAAARGRHRDR